METKQIEELADAIDKKIEGYAAKAATASDEGKGANEGRHQRDDRPV